MFYFDEVSVIQPRSYVSFSHVVIRALVFTILGKYFLDRSSALFKDKIVRFGNNGCVPICVEHELYKVVISTGLYDVLTLVSLVSQDSVDLVA